MKTRKIRVTVDTAERLKALFRTMPAEPVGPCPSDEELVAYALGMLQEEELETHLDSCLHCAIEVEQLVEAKETWRQEESQQRLAALREKVLQQWRLPPEPLVIALREAVADWRDALARPQLAWAALTQEGDSRRIWSWQSRDGLLRGSAVLEPGGQLTLRFSSEELDLEGRALLIHLGEIHREAVLQRVSEKEVGARVVILPHERLADLREMSLEVV